MARINRNGIALAVAMALVGGVSAFAAPASDMGAPGRLTQTDDGPVLVTSSGMTLYTNSGDDVAKGRTGCNNAVNNKIPDPTSGLGHYPMPGHQFVKSCLDIWKPYRPAADAKPGGDWTIFDRPEGGKQWVYKNSPVYLSVRDKAPGERNGVMGDTGFNRGPAFRFAGAERVEFPAGMRITRYRNSMVLATSDGKPVYTSRGDRVQRACSGCDAPVVPIDAASAAKLDGDWSMIDVGTGRPQYTFKGKPLFSAAPGSTDNEIVRSGFEQVVYRKMSAAPPEIGTQFTLVGDVYTDKSGRTLYMYSCTQTGCDLPGGGASPMAGLCGEPKECMRRWQPYVAAPGAKPSGEWSIIDIPQPLFTDGAGQLYPEGVPKVKGWAYRGRPVFTYYLDKQPGDIWGNTVRWFAMSSFSALRVPGRGVID